jgi:hypothetical protein
MLVGAVSRYENRSPHPACFLIQLVNKAKYPVQKSNLDPPKALHSQTFRISHRSQIQLIWQHELNKLRDIKKNWSSFSPFFAIVPVEITIPPDLSSRVGILDRCLPFTGSCRQLPTLYWRSLANKRQQVSTYTIIFLYWLAFTDICRHLPSITSIPSKILKVCFDKWINLLGYDYDDKKK